VLFGLSSACVSYRDSIRGKKNGKMKSKNAYALRSRPTYNMPEKHQQFARPNNAEKMIGTVTRKESKRQHDDDEEEPAPSSSFLPSFPHAAAALITNT
jgi:hypothetical protein